MASDGEEDFVTYGIALEPLEEDEPAKRPLPIQEQTVKDEKGRYMRFHGAFTGGFSAGYFNTVGSKEGWAPSTFVSSRQQKAEWQGSRPEDFMDEEDFSEHGIAPHEITTTDDFVSRRRNPISEKAQAISSMQASFPADRLLDFLVPARTSIGVELLKKMGWKEGQGLGPRVRKRPKAETRTYGCEIPPNSSEESEEEDFHLENVTFAPKDVMPVDFTVKDDVRGLGYQGLDPLQALGGGSEPVHINLFSAESDRTSSLFGGRSAGQQRKRGVAGQAFGVGALEDEDADIYHRDTMSNYDSVLGGEEPGDGLYGWTAPQQYRRSQKDTMKDASYLGKILEGFTLASKAAETKTVFPPPVLPRDFKPVHYFRPVVDSSTVSPQLAKALEMSHGQVSNQPLQQGSRHQLDSSQRRELLGESSIKGPNSVFELLSAEDQQKLCSIRSTTQERWGSSGGQVSEVGRAATVASGVAAAKLMAQRAQSRRLLSTESVPSPETEAFTAWNSPTIDISSAFRPFEKNPHKQARYELYISRLKQGEKDALDQSLDPTMTEWERGRERDEFVRAALLYKPRSSCLASRFTRSQHDEDDPDSVEVTRDQENNVDDKQSAVGMKMFGKLTRDTFEWHPDKLLCKRFNIPDPYPSSGIVGMPKVKKDKFSVFNFLTVTDTILEEKSVSSTSTSQAVAGKRSRWDISAPGNRVDDHLSEFLSIARNSTSKSQQEPVTSAAALPPPQHAASEVIEGRDLEQKVAEKKDGEEEEEEVTESRPPMDLFKAIFASSSDEKSSSSSEGESENEEEEEEVEGAAGLEEIKKPEPSSTTPCAPAPPPPSHTGPDSVQDREFGPVLPPPFLSALGEERQKRQKTKKKHKKNKKKQKKQKERGKKNSKKKRRRREEESSSNSGESDEDQGTAVLPSDDLLRRLKNLSKNALR
ncbi:G patch domain-containing protein 1 isoform X2 [Denticeps clupeoides]|uniref:G patch domain-containing protein 1 isoform X2 n=1 Tax=Denticeps clupeoides TaxID=299321 RepID=UPI0010A55FF2|nr:G patch domain-containing protein 1 isoform X2 [Denticeps clupeoides]